MFGLTMDEGAAILGEATVYADGSWLANVPPYIPVHLQPIDKFGLAIRNQRLWIQGMPGESRVCGGCHESRTGDNDARHQPEPDRRAEPRAPENFVTTPVVDARGVPVGRTTRASSVPHRQVRQLPQRHAERQQAADVLHADADRRSDRRWRPKYQIPYLELLRARRSPSYYDREVHTWPTLVRVDLLPGHAGDDDGRRHGDRRQCRRSGAFPSRRARACSSRSST